MYYIVPRAENKSPGPLCPFHIGSIMSLSPIGMGGNTVGHAEMGSGYVTFHEIQGIVELYGSCS